MQRCATLFLALTLPLAAGVVEPGFSPPPPPPRSPYAALKVPEEGATIVGQSVAYTIDIFTGAMSGEEFAARHTESYVCLELVGELDGVHFCHRLFGENVTDIRMLRVPYGPHVVATYLMDASTRLLLPASRKLRRFVTTDKMEQLEPPPGELNVTDTPAAPEEPTENIPTPRLEIAKPPSRAAVQVDAGVDFKLQVHARNGEAFARLFSSARGGAAALCVGPDSTTSLCGPWPVVGLAHPPRLVLHAGSHSVVSMLVHPNTGSLIEASASTTRRVHARNATTFRDHSSSADAQLLAAEINVDGVLMPIVLDADGEQAITDAAQRFCAENDIMTAGCVVKIAALLATL